MVISRGKFHSGEYNYVFDEIAAIKDVCGKNSRLKVILETGELGDYDHIRLARNCHKCWSRFYKNLNW